MLKINDTLSYHNRAYLYQATKRYDKAISDYNKIIEIDSNYIFGYSGKGYTLMLMEKNEEAISYFEKSLAICKKNNITKDLHELYFNISQAYINMGEIDKACPYIEKAVSLGNKHAVKYQEKYCNE